MLISDDAATFVSLFAPEPAINANRAALKVRERQFRAAFDPRKTVEMAQAIVTAKVKTEGHQRDTSRAFVAELNRTKTTDVVRHVEAQAAQLWWKQWAEFGMREFRVTSRWEKAGEIELQMLCMVCYGPSPTTVKHFGKIGQTRDFGDIDLMGGCD